MTELVLREDKGGVATLTLNRPDKLNAVNKDLFKALARHIEALGEAGDTVGCVVLRGAGRSFCAGHDLAAMSGDKGGGGLGWLRFEILTLEKLTALPQPVIAAVHGNCFTAGLEMALSADFIVAAESAVFSDTHARWGLVPGWGLSQRLPRRVGQAKALEMMLTSKRYSGREAEAMGLANLCVPDAALDQALDGFIEPILKNAWHSNAANKRLIYETDGMPIKQGIAHEVFRNEGFAKDVGARRGSFAERPRERKDQAS